MMTERERRGARDGKSGRDDLLYKYSSGTLRSQPGRTVPLAGQSQVGKAGQTSTGNESKFSPIFPAAGRAPARVDPLCGFFGI